MKDYPLHPNTRKALARLNAAADAIASLPTTMAMAYANGIPGQKVPVVDDRFKGKGNTRFEKLSPKYAKEKARAVGKKPILVRTGLLRSAVISVKHQISQSGDVATITFAGLPSYAIYHHEGVPSRNLPMRSPVQPEEADIIRIEAYAKRRLAAIYGKTTPGQQSQESGKASGV
jgi:hypothetical protein